MHARLGHLLLPALLLALTVSACQTGSQSVRQNSYGQTMHLYDAIDAIAADLIESARQSERITTVRKIAVADFVGPGERMTLLGDYISEKISVRIFGSGAFPDFMERRQLKQILQARHDELSGYFDQETVKQFGKLIGIDAMVVGSIKDLGGLMDVTAKIVESETGRIIGLADARVRNDATTDSLLAQHQVATLTISVEPPLDGEVIAGGARGLLSNGMAVIKNVPYGPCTVIIQPRGDQQIRRTITIRNPSETLAISVEGRTYEVSFQVVPPDARLTVNGQAVPLNAQGFAIIRELKSQPYSYVVQADGHEYRPGQFNPATETAIILNLQTSDPFLALKNKFFQKYKQIEQQQGFGIQLWSDKQSFRIGDTITFYFRAERDCHVTLVNVNASGSVTQLFPNRYHEDNRVRAGATYRIPDPSYGFEFRLEPPGGTERVYAIAATRPLDLFSNDFSQQAFTALRPGRTRDISVQQVGTRLEQADVGAAAELIVQSR